MKKIILLMILLSGTLAFSRYIEKCKVITTHSCKSLSSKKVFDFDSAIWGSIDVQTNAIYRVTFEGEGTKNLTFIDFEEIGN